MVIVFISVFQDEALVVRSLLESTGIEASMLVEGLPDSTPLFGLDMKGVRIAVRDEDGEDALAIVADFRAGKGSSGD